MLPCWLHRPLRLEKGDRYAPTTSATMKKLTGQLFPCGRQ